MSVNELDSTRVYLEVLIQTSVMMRSSLSAQLIELSSSLQFWTQHFSLLNKSLAVQNKHLTEIIHFLHVLGGVSSLGERGSEAQLWVWNWSTCAAAAVEKKKLKNSRQPIF